MVNVYCKACGKHVSEHNLIGFDAKWFCFCGSDINDAVVAAFAKEEASASSIIGR